VKLIVEQGAKEAASPAEVAAAAEVSVVVVLDDEQVRTVTTGSQGIFTVATPGHVVAIHSTIHLSTLRDIATGGSERGIDVVDAGVTGGYRAVRAGALAVMVGGTEAQFARVRPAFDAYAGLVLRMGPLGAGMAAKAARNLIGYVQVAACHEGLRLAEAAGVSVADLVQVLDYSSQYSQQVPRYLTRAAESFSRGTDGDPVEIERITGLFRKDLSVATAVAAEVGVDVPLAALVRDGARAVWEFVESPRAPSPTSASSL
jgi:3-hydroxyisobutyrate dehydrogenase